MTTLSILPGKTGIRGLNNSFVHGAAAYSVYALAPFVHGNLSWILAGLICMYAGWFRRAYLAAFLGGIIVAVVVWTTVGALSLPGTGFGVFFMVPFALLVILPVALVAYTTGKIISALVDRRAKRIGDR